MPQISQLFLGIEACELALIVHPLSRKPVRLLHEFDDRSIF